MHLHYAATADAVDAGRRCIREVDNTSHETLWEPVSKVQIFFFFFSLGAGSLRPFFLLKRVGGGSTTFGGTHQ